MVSWLRPLPALVVADLRQRYAGSVLGGLWAVLLPLVEVAAYAWVFGSLLGRWSDAGGWRYAVFVASGLLPWGAVRESIEGATHTLPSNRWIRRSRVPMELLVARQTLAAAPRAIVGVVLVSAIGLSEGQGVPGAALALAALVLQTAACWGTGLVVAPLATLVPDLRPALVSLLTVLTFGSPVLFSEKTVGPGVLRWLEWNPFTHLLRLYRFPLTGEGDVGRALVVAGGATIAVVAAGLLLRRPLWWAARDRL
jgi:lipopolysaccharide transport system permease protein